MTDYTVMLGALADLGWNEDMDKAGMQHKARRIYKEISGLKGEPSMKFYSSRTKHDPPRTYGDCFSACLSTLVQEKVPHVLHDNCDAPEARRRLDIYLKPRDLAFIEFVIPGEVHDALHWAGHFTQPSEIHYMLAGNTIKGGGHYVICKGEAIVHNPSPGVDIVTPFDDGYFWIGVIVKRT